MALTTIESLDHMTEVAARYNVYYDYSDLKKYAKRVNLEVDAHAKRQIEKCRKYCYAQHVDILERAGRKVRSYWELPIQLRRVLLNSM